MKTKQPKNIHPWFGYQIGNKFSELKASAESGHLPALLDALHLADEFEGKTQMVKATHKGLLDRITETRWDRPTKKETWIAQKGNDSFPSMAGRYVFKK